ncbi:hypothetical protein B7463_g10569, partial [Scytalidium lignicola]
MDLPQFCLIIALFAGAAHSHDHHAHRIAPGKYISAAPIDWILWLHVLIQTTAWMVIFPMGIILAVIKSRWHVPVQSGGVVLAITGHFLGHVHGGREFRQNVHAQMANLMATWLATQVACGIYLKLHLRHNYWVYMRPVVVATHAILGVGMPAVSWIQVVFGGFTAVGFCHGNAAGQCVARSAAGSTIIGVGFLVLVIIENERSGLNYYQFSSLYRMRPAMVMVSSNAIWIVDWMYQDPAQRVFLDVFSLGLIWLFAGAFVVCLALGGGGSWGRFVPGILVVINGWYIAVCSTRNAATVLNGALGFSMQCAGLSYLVMQCTKQTANNSSENRYLARFARMLTSYFLCACGILFMGTNQEQVQLLSKSRMSATTLVLLLHGATILMYGSTLLNLRILCQARITVATIRVSKGIDTNSQEQLLGKEFGFHGSSLPPAEHFDLEDIVDEA